MKEPEPNDFPITVFARRAGGIQFEIYAYRTLTDEEINGVIATYVASLAIPLDKINRIYTTIGQAVGFPEQSS